MYILLKSVIADRKSGNERSVDMEIRHLEAFVQTVNCNSFSKAAKLMQLSQPTVSSHINTLEKEMGTKLLIRTTKNMELTAKGRRFYEQVSEFLKMRDMIQQEFTDDKRDELSIDASISAAQWILPQLMKEFGQKNRQVKYHIRQVQDDVILNNVKKGLVDFGLTERFCSDESCESKLLCEYSLVLAMPANDYYKELLEKDLSICELLKEPMILQEGQADREEDFNRLLGKVNLDKSQLNVFANVRDCSGILQYVEAGLGIAVSNEYEAAKMAKEDRILLKPIPRELISRKVYLIYTKDCDNEIIAQFLNKAMKNTTI